MLGALLDFTSYNSLERYRANVGMGVQPALVNGPGRKLDRNRLDLVRWDSRYPPSSIQCLYRTQCALASPVRRGETSTGINRAR